MTAIAATHGTSHDAHAATAPPLLALEDVSKRFETHLDTIDRFANALGAGRQPTVVHAVDHASLALARGEVVGLVGESGCGKTTLGRMAAGLLAPTSGRRLWKGRDVATLDERGQRAARLGLQMIFQDAFASLNPRMRVRDIVGEAPLVHGLVKRDAIDGYVAELLGRVGLDAAAARRYPHQFSGGQRARIGIARALAVKPEMLVCDEAVAALDVSIQAQVLNLFIDLRRSLGLTYLFISHDLSVVRHVSDRIVVMYLGRIVESGPTEALHGAPNHPYTRALLAEVPRLDVRQKAYVAISGDLPSPVAPPPGCHFHPRCPHAMPRCKIEAPALRAVGPGRTSACHLNDASASS